MVKLVIDTETYSECDITTAGGFKYTSHPSTCLICMSYKIDDNRTKLWYVKAGDPPDDLVEAANAVLSGQGKVYAFNATFDLRIWNNCTGLPVLPPEHWIDVQAVCARYKLPQNLRQAAQALGCATEKMATGAQLIKKCCVPGGNPTEQNFADLCQYCIIDTDVLSEIMERLPTCSLVPMEQELWELTYTMNDAGVPVDITEVNAIIKYLKIYMEGQSKILPEITKGFVSTPGQVQKIKQFCQMHGVDIPNTTAETVEEYLAKEDLPYEVRTVLRLRQELGKSSVKKFLTLAQMYNDGVVQGNLNYYGAGTGRWAGRGFQYHNLPRAKVPNPDEVITQFISRDFMEDPVGKAKAVIRSMIKAPNDERIIVSDYSSIENRVLAWLAGDTLTLEGFRNNFDQYKDMASFLFKKDVEDIVKEERQLGKALVLGCIAEGTLVLTHLGPVPIEQITTEHQLFDGTEWVKHSGIIDKGLRQCVWFAGTWLTPDHEIYFNDLKEEVWHHVGSTQSEKQAISLAFGQFLVTHQEQILQSATLATMCDVNSADKLTFKFWQTLKKVTLLSVEFAGEKQNSNLIWSHIAVLQDCLKQMLTDLSIDGTRLNQDALLKQVLSTQIMEDVESQCVMNGLITLEHLLNMLCPYQDMTTQVSSSTELTMMVGTNPETSDLPLVAKIVKTHDVLLAGPRNRFMILSNQGPLIVSNCGYGMSHNRFILAAQTFGLTMGKEQAKFAVDAYRKKYYMIVKMWYAQANATKFAVQHPGKEFSTHRCKYKVVKDHVNHTWLRVTLPSGRALMYMNPKLTEGKYGPAVIYKGVNSTTFQWSDKELTPGLLAENVTQAASRDILCEGMLEIRDKMPEAKLILCVHDEAGALIKSDDITEGTMEKFNKLLCVDKDYRKDLPLAAEGYIARRYKKD